MNRVYSIFTPPFETTSGGIRVLYGLYGWLLIKGQIVYLNTTFDNPDKVVTIYPEIVNGNPLQGKHNIRYILQTAGVMSMYSVPSPTTQEFKRNPEYKNDMFYVFSRIYDTFGVDDNHVLFLPILNLHLFKDQKKKRTKTCYLVGKGINQNKHPTDSYELTRQFATDQAALADLLNSCHTFYCYDRLSAMMDIARLCGCEVRYHGDFTKAELSLYEPGTDGIFFPDGSGKMLNTEMFREHYEYMIETFSKKLDIFIETTQT